MEDLTFIISARVSLKLYCVDLFPIRSIILGAEKLRNGHYLNCQHFLVFSFLTEDRTRTSSRLQFQTNFRSRFQNLFKKCNNSISQR